MRAWIGRAEVGQIGADATRAETLLEAKSPWRPLCGFLRGVALHLEGDPEAGPAPSRGGRPPSRRHRPLGPGALPRATGARGPGRRRQRARRRAGLPGPCTGGAIRAATLPARPPSCSPSAHGSVRGLRTRPRRWPTSSKRWSWSRASPIPARGTRPSAASRWPAPRCFSTGPRWHLSNWQRRKARRAGCPAGPCPPAGWPRRGGRVEQAASAGAGGSLEPDRRRAPRARLPPEPPLLP